MPLARQNAMQRLGATQEGTLRRDPAAWRTGAAGGQQNGLELIRGRGAALIAALARDIAAPGNADAELRDARRRRELRLGEDGADAVFARLSGERVGRVVGRYLDEDRAETQQREIEDDVIGAVAERDTDTVALADAEIAEIDGCLADDGRQLAVSELQAAIVERRRVRPRLRKGEDGVGEILPVRIHVGALD